MPITIRRHAATLKEIPTVQASQREWSDPYEFIQSLHARYGQEFGSVKVLPPGNFTPSVVPWKSDSIQFKAKIQILGLLNGENRQEIAHETRYRIGRFLSGNPLPRDVLMVPIGDISYRVKIRKLQILLDREGCDWRKACSNEKALQQLFEIVRTYSRYIISAVGLIQPNIDDSVIARLIELLFEFSNEPERSTFSWKHLTVVPPSLPTRDRSTEFWTYVPKDNRHFRTRIVSEVRMPNGRFTSGTLPFVETILTDPKTGQTFKSRIDEEDVEMYLANGFSREASKSSTTCLLCEVCLVVCSFPVEASDVGPIQTSFRTADEHELSFWRQERPSLMCSGCSIVIHVDCVGVGNSFVDKAILYHIARTNCDWFCSRCIDAGSALSTLHALSYGYQFTDSMTRRDYEKRGNARGHVLGVKQGCRVEDAERVFWSLLDEDHRGEIPVLYGSDLDSRDVAGGPFPDGFQSFTSSNIWDLRNLTLHSDSVLKHLSGAEKITGVTRPWMYLGSPLSAFCWHSEDQFLCSISYHHSGAPKVWYTVPGHLRVQVETAISSLLPDLASANKDIHHHLVTMVSPDVLADIFRIPVGRVVQNPGEFIITFPQAYHSGFNVGCNLAEAVNVACPDWLQHGLRSMSAYARVQRPSVFCFERLVYNMAMAVVSKTETRKSVAEFCSRTLDILLDRIQEVLPAVTSKVDPRQITEVCCICKQFCYYGFFEFKSGYKCLTCALDTEKERGCFYLKHSFEHLVEIADLVDKRLQSCTEIRRSSRVPSSKRTRI